MIMRLAAAALALVGLVGPGLGQAQGFPARPITLVVPFATGAANDLVARVLVEYLREPLGVVVVDNRPGGNAMLGADIAKRAKPDGYTWLLGGNSFLMSTAIATTGSVDFLRDFDPIGIIARLPFYLVINREAVPVETVRELVAYAKQHPGKLAYATPGNAMPHHFGAELLRLQAGLELLHVPYKGMAQGALDLVAGRVQLTVTGFPAIAPHVKTGKLKLLANAGATRSERHPDVPTLAEAGVPGVDVDAWIALYAPAGTPIELIRRINTEVNAALRRPELRERLAAQGLQAAGGTPAALGELMKSELERWRRVARAANIRPD